MCPFVRGKLLGSCCEIHESDWCMFSILAESKNTRQSDFMYFATVVEKLSVLNAAVEMGMADVGVEIKFIGC